MPLPQQPALPSWEAYLNPERIYGDRQAQPNPQSEPIELTLHPTHEEIIATVYEWRVMLSPWVQALYFTPELFSEKQKQQQERGYQSHFKRYGQPIKRPGIGQENRCRDCLRDLVKANYLYRKALPISLPQGGRSPYVYFLGQKGAEHLCEMWEISRQELGWKPKQNSVTNLFLRHKIDENAFRLATVVSARRAGLEIIEWIDDDTLHRTQKRKSEYVTIRNPDADDPKVRKARTPTEKHVPVIPDIFFGYRSKAEDYYQIVEIDRSTTIGAYSKWGDRDWKRKILAHLEYFHSGKYERRFGTKKMRGLVICKSMQRLKNLKRLTEEVGGSGAARFHFATTEQTATHNVLIDPNPIWQKGTKQSLENEHGVLEPQFFSLTPR